MKKFYIAILFFIASVFVADASSTPDTLNLKLYLEGFYTGSGLMRTTLYNLGYSTDTTATDTIQVNLWLAANLSNTSPDYSAKTILHKNGTASITFPSTVNGNSYYIAIYHRNTIETWSANPVAFATTTSYDFTTSELQAYQNPYDQPMKNMGSGVFAFYAGDVSQDGEVDLTDMADVDNDIQLFAFGYINTDCNGNGVADVADMTFIDNNAILFLFFAMP